jgi:nuclear pore complex protein Nup155
MTFEELITGQNGVAASRALVNVIIDQQIGQQIAVSNVAPPGLDNLTKWTYQVDTISDILQTRCGSFCSTDDVMLYKVRVLCCSSWQLPDPPPPGKGKRTESRGES